MSRRESAPLVDLAAPVQGLHAAASERLPAHDLWPGIERRLAPRSRPGSQRLPYALAASVMVALFAGLLLRQQSSTTPAEPALRGATPTVAVTPPATTETGHPYSGRYTEPPNLAALSPRTLRTLRSESLDDAPVPVGGGGSGLMRATYSSAESERASHSQQAILRANLRLVTQAEREVRRALKADPTSTSLHSLLAVAQEKRAALVSLLVHEQD